ncbi:CPBP family intramembrane glutamic endopeptidase [Natronosalvus rutilus]|uniref:CPBP family intramembrane metalloprotease n=1 Tax=Natronosalvus rutilus TaxID=2953753 RepID=A0A9E7NAN0_9EURY|nr:CPBP family intramembrane glutamic endopeptidase [Natronosalvus rutilus]UTF53375.1 CPBP family intramembrane metalloprotease [Natronosalvus rutilus]
MTQWAAFAGLSGVVLVALLVLSVLTQRAFEEPNGSRASRQNPLDAESQRPTDRPLERTDSRDQATDAASREAPPEEASASAVEEYGPASDDVAPVSEAGTPRQPTRTREPTRSETGTDPHDISTGALLANVALSQGLFAAVLLGAAVYTSIPLEALGIEFDSNYLRSGLLLGAVAGVVLYATNEVGAALATRLGVDHDEALRGLLAPDDVRGWVVLLVAVLPVVAFFEEFLFRAALIGALAVGFDVPIWLLAVGSSVAFAVGHGMQGPAGIVVTGLLGFVLAALFIATGSLLAVVVAHYLVNALEFVVHEGLGLEPVESVLERVGS